MYQYAVIAFMLFCGSVLGYEFDGGQIDVPKGFEGPISKELGKGILSTGFTFPHGDNTAAVLQISIWKVGDDLTKIPENKIKSETEKYLLHFLKGISNNRSNFVNGKIEYIQISNHLVAKVKWAGTKEGYNTHGILYCLIKKDKVYSFHAQDYSEHKHKYTNMAVNAIENIALNP